MPPRVWWEGYLVHTTRVWWKGYLVHTTRVGRVGIHHGTPLSQCIALGTPPVPHCTVLATSAVLAGVGCTVRRPWAQTLG